jgi:MFS family permease
VLISSAGSAWTADLVPKEQRGRINGSSGFFSLISISVGQLIGGWIYDNISHTLPYTLQIILMIPPFLIILLKTKENEIKSS